jgi:hypothetical protein
LTKREKESDRPRYKCRALIFSSRVWYFLFRNDRTHDICKPPCFFDIDFGVNMCSNMDAPIPNSTAPALPEDDASAVKGVVSRKNRKKRKSMEHSHKVAEDDEATESDDDDVVAKKYGYGRRYGSGGGGGGGGGGGVKPHDSNISNATVVASKYNGPRCGAKTHQPGTNHDGRQPCRFATVLVNKAVCAFEMCAKCAVDVGDGKEKICPACLKEAVNLFENHNRSPSSLASNPSIPTTTSAPSSSSSLSSLSSVQLTAPTLNSDSDPHRQCFESGEAREAAISVWNEKDIPNSFE